MLTKPFHSNFDLKVLIVWSTRTSLFKDIYHVFYGFTHYHISYVNICSMYNLSCWYVLIANRICCTDLALLLTVANNSRSLIWWWKIPVVNPELQTQANPFYPKLIKSFLQFLDGALNYHPGAEKRVSRKWEKNIWSNILTAKL